MGELARGTGLTVRALHHDDRLGLLVPSERTPAGHRHYSEAERLYPLLVLRDVGLPLTEIGHVLDDDGPDLATTVRRHLRAWSSSSSAVSACVSAWSSCLSSLEDSVEPPLDQFIEAMAVIEADVDVVMRVPYEAADDEGRPPRLKMRYPGRKVALLKEREGRASSPDLDRLRGRVRARVGLCGQTTQGQ